jgi:hypothetical protein
MHKKKVFVKNGVNVFRVDKVANQKVEVTHLHPDYAFGILGSVLTETGLLEIFKLESKNPTLPYFVGRWDQSIETLDVDIFNAGSRVSDSFRAERGGYAGHHPLRTSDRERRYSVKISLPGTLIFEGFVSFNTNHGHAPGLFQPI